MSLCTKGASERIEYPVSTEDCCILKHNNIFGVTCYSVHSELDIGRESRVACPLSGAPCLCPLPLLPFPVSLLDPRVCLSRVRRLRSIPTQSTGTVVLRTAN
jgi:hypothetical protein